MEFRELSDICGLFLLASRNSWNMWESTFKRFVEEQRALLDVVKRFIMGVSGGYFVSCTGHKPT